MNIAKSCGLIATGFVAGMLLVISCSDDHPVSADAATCDCPAAEPPLAGRIQHLSNTRTIPANSRGGQGAACAVGSVRLSGGCGTENGQPADIVLHMSAPSDGDLSGWSCDFMNNSTAPVTIKASVFCLTPAF